MVLRDSGWMKLDPYSEEPYFGDMFLKPHPRKKDGGLIFFMPGNAKMPIFGLVFNPIVWREIEALREKEVRFLESVHSNILRAYFLSRCTMGAPTPQKYLG
jgi:hypothetical protein